MVIHLNDCVGIVELIIPFWFAFKIKQKIYALSLKDCVELKSY